MVGADKASFVAMRFLNKTYTSVGAPVFHNADSMIGFFLAWVDMVSGHDDLALTNLGFFEVPQLGYFCKKAYIAPMRPIKYFIQLLGMNLRVCVNPKRNLTGLFTRPDGSV